MTSPIYQYVSEDITLPNTAPWGIYVDLAIPTGSVVVGSGLLVTAVEIGSSWVTADSLTPTEFADGFGFGTTPGVFTGPCPTDSTKWRVMVLQPANAGEPAHATAWITTLQTFTTVSALAVSS